MNEVEKKMFEIVKSRSDIDAYYGVGVLCPLTPGEPDHPDHVIPDLNTQDENGFTLLHYAAERGMQRTVMRLLKEGASSDIENNIGETPLMLALRQRPFDTRIRLSDMIILLIENGAKVHAPNKGQDIIRSTCLNVAITSNDIPFIEYLLNHKIKLDINLQLPQSGYTALHFAALDNRAEITTLLLKAGADQSITNSKGYTPLKIAEKMKHMETLSVLNQNKTPTAASRDFMQASSSSSSARPPLLRPSSTYSAPAPITHFFNQKKQAKSSHSQIPWIKSIDTAKCTQLELGSLIISLKKNKFSVLKGETYMSLNFLTHKDQWTLSKYLKAGNVEGIIKKIDNWGETSSAISAFLRKEIEIFQQQPIKEEKRFGPGFAPGSIDVMD